MIVNAAPKYSHDVIDVRCRELMGVAEAIMYSRQNGMPLRNSLKVLDRNFTLPKEQKAYDSAQQIVIQAYEEPYYHSEEAKLIAINEFASLYYRACIDFYTQ